MKIEKNKAVSSSYKSGFSKNKNIKINKEKVTK